MYDDLKDRYKTPLAHEAMKLIGVKEFQGESNNPIIIQWANELGHTIKEYYRKDSIAWCGLFIGICAKRSGYIPPSGFDTLRARSWVKWGDPIKGEPVLWDILIFERQGGGHVGIYVGEDKVCYHVLGGNQGDEVSIVRIPKERFLMARKEPMNSFPKAKVKIIRDAKSKPSENEV